MTLLWWLGLPALLLLVPGYQQWNRGRLWRSVTRREWRRAPGTIYNSEGNADAAR